MHLKVNGRLVQILQVYFYVHLKVNARLLFALTDWVNLEINFNFICTFILLKRPLVLMFYVYVFQTRTIQKLF